MLPATQSHSQNVVPIRRLGVIGTDGRLEDSRYLSVACYERMCNAARTIVKSRKYTHLVSGGSAWVEHIAVAMVLGKDLIHPRNLTLHLPTFLFNGRFDDSVPDGAMANRHHKLFSERIGIDSLGMIAEAAARGALVVENPGGFFARGEEIVRDSTGLLAFTFGTGEPWKGRVHGGSVDAESAQLKRGGVSSLWNRCKAAEKIHVSIAPMP